MRLHSALVRIMDIAHLDVYTSHYRKEPNYGVARKIRHPAVRRFWYDRIAPRVLGSHTGMSRRAPPGLHPKLVEDHLACIDTVTQAPIMTVVVELTKFLKLEKRERMVLPYLLGGGCCDHESGGVFTMGCNPCCYPEAFEEAWRRFEDHSQLVLLGPGGAGWPDTEKGQQSKARAVEEEKRLETVYYDGMRQAGEFIDCKALQAIIDFWCPLPDAQRHRDAEEILPHFYTETRWEHLERRKLALELPLRAKKLYPPYPTVKGVRALGGKAVFRAGVFVIIAGLRLWRSQPWGLRSFLEGKIEDSMESEEKLRHSIMMAEQVI